MSINSYSGEHSLHGPDTAAAVHQRVKPTNFIAMPSSAMCIAHNKVGSDATYAVYVELTIDIAI